jgi:LacI family transcriptional regulator
VAFGREATDTRAEVLEGARFLIDRDCDGLIVMSNALTADDVRELHRLQPNLVVLNSSFEGMSHRCFMADHRAGGRLAALTLLEKGHRKIALIGGPATSPDNEERLAGFRDALREAGIAAEDLPSEQADFSTAGGYAAACRLFEHSRDWTALFCANDEMAVGALACCAERGLRVPTDISVIGYDDTPTAEFAVPRLTSVHMPIREVTVAATRTLLNQCYGLELRVERDFAVSVTQRASLAPAH